ncbi:MAG TPA: protein-L-isoaspartate O-methyltransferase [Steroidobacteraceae bacterium]|nr:protein-L-isoaspartate O-methyltransferase [Steroidobacteraceae bacterium]
MSVDRSVAGSVDAPVVESVAGSLDASLDVVDAREQMVEQQVRAWDVLDERILGVLREVPRERFVPASWRELAYADCEIPLPCGKRMLRPMIVGRLLQALQVQAHERVLEVGTGSGYVSACLARLGARVRSLELHAPLATFAEANLRAVCGVSGAASVSGASGAAGGATPPAVPAVPAVEVLCADAMQLAEESAYDVVVLTASLPLHEPRFERALRPGGRLFAVIGATEPQQACLIRRASARDFTREVLFETVIEPLEHAPRPEAFGF